MAWALAVLSTAIGEKIILGFDNLPPFSMVK
jgi:hypothetical protein